MLNCPTEHCETSCILHPRQAGYLVYCSDCCLVAVGETAEEAKANWDAGKRTEQDFDRSELL